MIDLLPRRLVVAFLIPIVLVVVGTTGYTLIEGWDPRDSLYMTVITLTTVGFKEVQPMDRAGEVFTMFLCMGGIFTLFYAATEVVRAIFTGELNDVLGKQRMARSLAAMHDHMIVCGYGRMGRLVCQEFASQGLPYVIVDRDADALEGYGGPHGVALHGDTTSDEVLKRAGIDRARALIAVLASDADNLYTTMSARLLNEDLFIVARAEDPASEQKMLRAGANRVVSPYLIGGARVAQAVLRPTVVDFIELATRTEHFELQIEETQITAPSPLVGTILRDNRIRQEFGVIILAIKKSSGRMVFNPPPETALEAGDILIVIGGRESLDRLDRLATG